MYIPDKLKQTAKIKNVESGKVDTIGIETGGTNYKVGDPIEFVNPPHASNGAGAAANISVIAGKVIDNISVASSTITPVEIYPGETRGDMLLFVLILIILKIMKPLVFLDCLPHHLRLVDSIKQELQLLYSL